MGPGLRSSSPARTSAATALREPRQRDGRLAGRHGRAATGPPQARIDLENPPGIPYENPAYPPGGPVEEIRPGDVVWFPPGEKHWHGAAPTTAMSHIAVQEKLGGKTVDWMEKVGDEQYRR